jgi:hypothetical protein
MGASMALQASWLRTINLIGLLANSGLCSTTTCDSHSKVNSSQAERLLKSNAACALTIDGAGAIARPAERRTRGQSAVLAA